MAGKKTEAGSAKTICPLGKIFQGLENLSGNAPEFKEHLGRSGLELLKAVKALVDAGIDTLEKKKSPERRKVAKKITVE
ncbi:MAG: hypothetical protein K9N10_13545 [Deltaproteobacteria bacterium]|nr:hypothetical protein [Deltaproteobacteria bacterium]